MNKNYFLLVFLLFGTFSFSQSISINSSTYNAQQLVQDVLIDSPCAIVSNFSSSASCGYGYFSYPGTNFAFAEGVIIRNGIATTTAGQYSNTNISTECSLAGDAQLQAISNANGQPDIIDDVSFIQFDFTPLTDSFSFNFIFASNEYGMYQCNYADVFAFILTDLTTNVSTNLAVIPGTTTPVSVVNVRDMAHNGGCGSSNASYFDTYNPSLPAASTVMNMDGYTVPMIASATVVPNRNYRIKLAIGDYQDSLLDSAVFIEGGSFNVGIANIQYPVDAGIESGDMTVANGLAMCPGETRVINTGLNPADFTFEWTKDGVL